jgi:hypothetical protein
MKKLNWYEANYKIQGLFDSKITFQATQRQVVKLANNELKRPNAELLNIYLLEADKYIIIYGDSFESLYYNS